ncbi:MAG: ABC transporter permease [Rhodospirillaceae bacterium]
MNALHHLRQFSRARCVAMMVKEFIQMRRDRMTFAMMVGVPVMQLMLFGFAINSDPKHLPTALHIAEPSPFARDLVEALANSGYFQFTHSVDNPARLEWLLAANQVQFALTIPVGFAAAVQRGERPVVLLEADATDPAATGNALGALATVNRTALDRDLTGALAALKDPGPPFEVRVHRRYNPDAITQYNIVPGLMGVILTMTGVMLTALAVTRERERGTMENLLAMPLRPTEVMIGKIVPYIIIGYVQVTIVLLAAHFIFKVPMIGSLWLLSAGVLLFITANLAVGFTFSTLATNQLQAMQGTFFFFLPSILLSGFMFPFRGMPVWAQNIGEILPLTHFLRIVRGILLKGNGLTEIAPDLWPLALFVAVVTAIALKRYRKTLD